MSPETPPPPPGQEQRRPGRFGGDQGWPRWMIWVLLAVIIGFVVVQGMSKASAGMSGKRL